MSKTLKFSDSKFFGGDFTRKYSEFKERTLREIGPVNLYEIMPSLVRIIGFEGRHREQLNKLAIVTAKNLFPVIDITGIQIDAKIQDNISHKDISSDGTPDYPEPLPELDNEMFKKAAKQKILNAFSQGAAVSMNTIHHMVNELNDISVHLKENYDTFLKGNEVAYLTTPEEDFVRMAINANEEGGVGGTNRVEFRDGIPFIIARADNFVILVHEIIKGLYTYLALNAYDTEYEYYEVAQFTESIASEIEDIGCGKMIINLLRNYLLDNFDKYYVHECFFEMFIVAMAKLPADEMISLMEGLIKGIPNRSKFEVLARNCYYDLKDFDKKKSLLDI